MRDDPAGEEAGRDQGRFTVGVRPVPDADAFVLALEGELDRDAVGTLWAAVERCDRAERLLVDCSGLGFCDSSGLNALLKARLRMAESGGRVDLAGLRPPVGRMFEITGARGVFQVYGSVAEALSDDGPGGGGSHEAQRR